MFILLLIKLSVFRSIENRFTYFKKRINIYPLKRYQIMILFLIKTLTLLLYILYFLSKNKNEVF